MRRRASPRAARRIVRQVERFARPDATATVTGRYRAVVFVEYTVLLGVVVLAGGLALYGLGVPMMQSFYLTKLFLLLPVP